MSYSQVILYLFALLSIYTLAAAFDEQAEPIAHRAASRISVAGCTHAAWQHGAPLPAATLASNITLLAC